MLRGFTLLETMVAMVLVAIAMTGLAMTFLGSSKYGMLSRRQANAVTLARTLAGQLSHADYADPRLANSNLGNDGTFADAAGLFARTALPTGANAPDAALGTFAVGNESYDAYVNVAAQMDPVNSTQEMGRYIAVIVRYRVGAVGSAGAVYMRAVALAYRYNPALVGVGTLPL